MWRVALLAQLVPLGLLIVPACGRTSDPVRATLERVREAVERRDVDGISSELADDFQAANGEGRDELAAGLRRILAGYESISIRLSDITTERGTGLAHVTFRAVLAGKPRGIGGAEAFLPRAATYRFDLRLVERDGRYRVTKAAWNPE
jgi:hypothetical protein